MKSFPCAEGKGTKGNQPPPRRRLTSPPNQREKRPTIEIHDYLVPKAVLSISSLKCVFCLAVLLNLSGSLPRKITECQHCRCGQPSHGSLLTTNCGSPATPRWRSEKSSVSVWLDFVKRKRSLSVPLEEAAIELLYSVLSSAGTGHEKLLATQCRDMTSTFQTSDTISRPTLSHTLSAH